VAPLSGFVILSHNVFAALQVIQQLFCLDSLIFLISRGGVCTLNMTNAMFLALIVFVNVNVFSAIFVARKILKMFQL